MGSSQEGGGNIIMGRVQCEYLTGPRIYTCQECGAHLALHDDIVSKAFQGRNGRAYLFANCVNYSLGPKEDRMLMTGMHTVCDIFCNRCNSQLGWTYIEAYETSQKYKIGKFIVEKAKMMRDRDWEFSG